MPKLTKPEEFSEIFAYKDGKLYWKVHVGRVRPGEPAGTTTVPGDSFVWYQCNQYKVKDIIWIMHEGAIPGGMVVKHLDSNRTNNCIQNLTLEEKEYSSRRWFTRRDMEDVWNAAKGDLLNGDKPYEKFADIFNQLNNRHKQQNLLDDEPRTPKIFLF